MFKFNSKDTFKEMFPSKEMFKFNSKDTTLRNYLTIGKYETL